MSNKIYAGFKYLINPNYRFQIQAGKGKYNNLPDEEYLKRLFKATMGYPLDLVSPITFSEKLQWLKLYDRDPRYVKMVDKYLARSYVGDLIGEKYLIPLLGVWDHPDDIDFDELPNQFVLKCNHNSGLGMCICKDKRLLDIPKTRRNLYLGLSQDYFITGREWPYKDVPRKIVGEMLLHDDDDSSNQEGINDYKFFCFNGVVKFFKVDFDRFVDHHANYYDIHGYLLPFGEKAYPPKPERKLRLPENLAEMIELASILSHGVPFVRVDFYNVSGRIYFGELTFFPISGLGEYAPKEWDRIIGDYLMLPERGDA